MNRIEKQEDANRFLEGGVFYPTGYVVAAFPSKQDADSACEALARRSIVGQDVMPVTPEEMEHEARRNIDQATPLLSAGASLPVREKQLKLAQEGCHFLIIAADNDERTRVVTEALSQAPVRYAVKYNRLTIDNLVRDIPSSTPDREPARVP